MPMLASLGGCLVAADFLIIGAVGMLGTTLGDGSTLDIAVYLETTLGDGPHLEISNIWMWILAGTGFWISMQVGTGFLMNVASEVMMRKRLRLLWT